VTTGVMRMADTAGDGDTAEVVLKGFQLGLPSRAGAQETGRPASFRSKKPRVAS